MSTRVGCSFINHTPMGYLALVKARGVTSLAEVFAAGYECAGEHYTGKS